MHCPRTRSEESLFLVEKKKRIALGLYFSKKEKPYFKWAIYLLTIMIIITLRKMMMIPFLFFFSINK